MRHEQKREEKKRGTRKYTLRWREGDDPESFDTTYTYFGDGLDKTVTFGQHRRKMIELGISKGRIFMGEIRGSQTRMPIEHCEYKKVAHARGKIAGISRMTTLYLLNLETLIVERWNLSDDYAGWVVEFNGFGYEFSSSIHESQYPVLFTEHEVRYIEVLKRLHTPTEEQLKPTEVVEREVSEDQLADFSRTGLVSIPVPSREELEGVTRKVEVARRDDDGKVKPTPTYFSFNPMKGEIITIPASKARTIKAAQAMVDIFDDEHKGETVADFYVGLQRFAAAGDESGYLLAQGVEFDWQEVEKQAMEYLKEVKRDADPQVHRDVADAVGRMILEQNNDYPGKGMFPEAHIVGVKNGEFGDSMYPDAMFPEGYRSLCGQNVTENFIGLDRYNAVGAPSFTPICGECLLKVLPDNVNPDKHPLEVKDADVGRVGDHLLLTQTKPSIGELQELEEHFGTEITQSDEERVKQAKDALENWVKDRVMIPDPKARNFYYYNEWCLGMFYYGDTTTSSNLTRPNVHYILINWRNRKIEMNGSDYQPNLSNRDDPTGARSAEEFLAFLEGKDFIEHNTLEGWRNDLLWRDQYGEKVPEDLTLILDYSVTSLDPALHKSVMSATWYEMGGHLWVSEAAIPDGEDVEEPITPEELECYPREHSISKVADGLKRYSPEDGYYHA